MPLEYEVEPDPGSPPGTRAFLVGIDLTKIQYVPLFDGGGTAGANTRGLTGIQRAILAHVGREGFITPAQAGPYAHAGRRPDHAYGYTGSSCCQYGSKDGLESVKRLVARGLLVRTAKGRYESRAAE